MPTIVTDTLRELSKRSETHAKIALDSFGAKIRDMREPEVRALATQLYDWCKNRLGHLAKDEDPRVKTETIAQVSADLSIDFPHIAEAEVWQAVRRGMSGEYGDEVIIFSANNVFSWIKKYITKNKSEAMRHFVEVRNGLETKPVPTDAERYKMHTDSILKAYADYSIDCRNFDYKTYIPHYDFLSEIGIAVCDNTRKKEIYAENLKKVKAMDWEGFSDKQGEYEKFLQHLENPNPKGSPNFFTSQAKVFSIKQAMLEFFLDCSAMEVDLEEVILQAIQTKTNPKPDKN